MGELDGASLSIVGDAERFSLGGKDGISVGASLSTEGDCDSVGEADGDLISTVGESVGLVEGAADGT